MINDETDSAGIVDYAWSHAIISDQLYHNIKECDHQGSVTNECSVHYRGFAEAYSDIDIYSIYTPVCLSEYSSTRISSRLVVAPRLLSKLHVRAQKHQSFSFKSLARAKKPGTNRL